MLGRVLGGRYRIQRVLGHGGLASTFEADDLVAGAPVALKLLRQPARARALREEFARLRGLFHPHLVRVLDFAADADGGLVYYTAELVDGEPLDVWLGAEPRTWDATRRALAHALDALAFLHALEIRHGDFKPGNILVDARGRATLIDLSCADRFDRDASSDVSGTPGYLAPEILAGERADGRADLFAAGVTLRNALERASGAPERIARLAARSCASSPSARPSSAAEVLEALGETPGAGPPLGRAPRLLGREPELARFDALLDAFLRGEEGPRVCVLHGAPGSGRSRLLSELVWRAQLRARVVHGEQSIVGLLTRALGGALGPSVTALLAARDGIREPLVLALDDVDALSEREKVCFDAWLRTAERDGRVLLLCACASAPSISNEAILGVAVDPLAPAELVAWSRGLVSPSRVPELHRVTGGFPAHVEGILAQLAAGTLSESELASAVVDERPLGIASFPPPQARALGVLALLDRPLRDVGAFALDTDALLALQARGYVVGDEHGMRLARPAESSRIRSELAPSVVAKLHREIADWLRTQADGVSAEVVEHLARSGDRAEARALLLASAVDHDRAPRAWARAAAAISVPREDVELTLTLARFHELSGEPQRALSLIARAVRCRPAEPWLGRCRARAGSVYLKLGRAQRALRYSRATSDADGVARAEIQLGRHREALEHARDGLAGCGPDERAALHESAGLAAAYLGELAVARTHLTEARQLQPSASPRSRMRLLSYEAIAEFRAGNLGAAAAKYHEALELAELHGLDDQLASAASNLGTTYQQHGDWGLAIASYERGLRIARALGKQSTEVALEFNLANLWAAIGLFDRSTMLLERVEERAGARDLRYFLAATASLRGEIALWRGDVGTARRELERARAAFDTEHMTREVVEMDLHLAECSLASGDAGAALARVDGVISTVDALGARDLGARTLATRASCLVSADRAHEAIPILERALAASLAIGDRQLEADVLGRASDAFERQGASVAAASHAARARDVWDRIAASLPREHRDAFHHHPRRSALSRRDTAGQSKPDGAPETTTLGRLLEINRQLSSTLAVDNVLACALDAAIELSGAERGFVILRRGDALDVVAARNLDREKIGRSHLKFSRGIAESVVESGEAIVTVDAEGDPRFAGNASVHAMHLQSVACVPIRSPERLLGAIYLDNRFQRGRFARTDVTLLLGFADQVAIALQNASLYTALEARTRELEASKSRVEELLRGREQEIGRLEEEVRTRQASLQYRYDYGQIVGRSAGMRQVLATLDRVIDSSLSVLIQGESGTGKELVARAIHFNGARRGARFVALNCAALPDALLESELFGHVRGAFTGADGNRVGLLVAARGGTVFLDEIGEMPLAMQAKLLRALQEREVRPLGSNEAVPIDVRVVSATNRSLRNELGTRFREDLFYRLAVVEVTLPPLRDRVEDLPELARAILERFASEAGRVVPRLDPSAMAALFAHRWPGNVRELVNVLSRALAFADGERITIDDLALAGTSSSRSSGGTRDAERQRLRAALEASAWNVTEVSRTLAIPRNTLYRKLKRYGLDRPPRAGASG